MKTRTINLELSYVEGRLRGSGRAELSVSGTTKGGEVHRIVIVVSPDCLGIFGTEAHKVINEARAGLAAAEAGLKG